MILKVFISQPMKDLSDKEILDKRHAAIKEIQEHYGEGREIEILDSFYLGAPADIKPLWFLGRSIQVLSMADIAYFCEGWEEARGCQIEYECAKQYGIPIIKERGD